MSKITVLLLNKSLTTYNSTNDFINFSIKLYKRGSVFRKADDCSLVLKLKSNINTSYQTIGTYTITNGTIDISYDVNNLDSGIIKAIALAEITYNGEVIISNDVDINFVNEDTGGYTEFNIDSGTCGDLSGFNRNDFTIVDASNNRSSALIIQRPSS